MNDELHIRRQLQSLYGTREGEIWLELQARINDFASRNPSLSRNNFEMTERDAVLITYGDQFQSDSQQDLRSLLDFLDEYLADEVNWVHLLPFYPYASDDGFSVIDYRQVKLVLSVGGVLCRGNISAHRALVKLSVLLYPTQLLLCLKVSAL